MPRAKIKDAPQTAQQSGGVISASHKAIQAPPRGHPALPLTKRQLRDWAGRLTIFLCATLAVLVWFSIFIPIQKTLRLGRASGSLTHQVIRLKEAAFFPAKAIRLSKHSKSHQTFKGLSSPPTPPGEGSNVGSCLPPSTLKALDTNRS